AQMESKRILGNNDALLSGPAILDDSMTHRASLWLTLECFQDGAQLVGCPPIVSVKESDDVATKLGDPGVKGRALPAVGLVDVANSGRELGDDLRRCISRTVVDDNDFEVLAADILFQDADQSRFDKRLMVIRIHQNADGRNGHDCCSCLGL